MIDDQEQAMGQAEAEFDLDQMTLASGLRDAHQEGNYLIGVTDTGVRFRQRLPINKMLSKNEKGDWTLIDLHES